jgi:hypothetical protein
MSYAADLAAKACESVSSSAIEGQGSGRRQIELRISFYVTPDGGALTIPIYSTPVELFKKDIKPPRTSPRYVGPDPYFLKGKHVGTRLDDVVQPEQVGRVGRVLRSVSLHDRPRLLYDGLVDHVCQRLRNIEVQYEDSSYLQT